MHTEEEQNPHTKRAFTPTKMELIVLPIVSFLFLIAANTFTYFRTVDDTNYLIVTDYMQLRFRSALGTIDELLGPTTLTIAFWMVIGLIVYIIAWLSYTTYVAYKNDIPITKGMVVPKEYNRSKVLHESIVRFLTRLISTILFVAWLYFFFAEALPAISILFLDGITRLGFEATISVVWSVAALSLSIFIFSLLIRCMVLRDRVFGN